MIYAENHTPELLSVAEAAALLHVHPRTIRNRIRAGLLPARTLTGTRTVRVERADVLAQLTEAPLDAPPPASPAIERLSTPQGRARALVMLDALLAEPDDEEDDGYDLQAALAAWPLSFHTVTLPDGDDA